MSGQGTDVRQGVGGRAPAGQLELVLARLLNAGTYASVALFGLGLVAMLANGVRPLGPAPTLDPARLPADLLAGRPEAFLWLGLVTAIATPTVRVVAALAGFVRAREWGMAAIAGAVVAVILLSVVVARLAEA